MDYCYDPNAPIVLATTTTTIPTTQALSGCSAEVRACSGGGIVYQDPDNNCLFAPCPRRTPQPAQQAASTPAPRPTVSPATSSPTFDGSSFYCGYSLDQVNDKCDTARPCPSGLNRECGGLEVCLQDTDCGSAQTTTTSTMGSATAATLEPCDELCVDILASDWCPEETNDLNLPNCLEVSVGQLCESDGECATNDALNNCDTYDIYARVECSGTRKSQGELMRGTRVPTVGPSRRLEPSAVPTVAPSTGKPTMAPVITTGVPTIDAMKMAMAAASAAESTAPPTSTSAPESTSISIADAIATATANSAASGGSLQSSAEIPTSPPIKEYESNAAAAISYNRSPGGGSEATAATAATTGEEEEPMAVGSTEWYNSVYGDESMSADGDTEDEGWSFDHYFRSPSSRNSARKMTISLIGSIPIIIGVAAATVLAC